MNTTPIPAEAIPESSAKTLYPNRLSLVAGRTKRKPDDFFGLAHFRASLQAQAF